MAKECINCGRSIKFYQENYWLSNEGVYFCETCGQKVKPLLQDIKIAITMNSYNAAKEKFDKELSLAELNENAKKYIQYEFDDIAQHIPGIESKRLHNAKVFNGSFNSCCNAVYLAGKTVSGEEPVVPMQCIKLPTGRADDYYIVTAVFESYFMRTGSYASLSITMVWVPDMLKPGKAIVSAVASGGGEGLFNISWGAESDFVDGFWRALKDQNPEFELREYRDSFWEGGVEFGDCFAETESKGNATVVSDFTGPSFSGKRKTEVPENRIGILGGTFDPVHIGHLALARAAITEANLEKLLVMPAYIQPFKQGKRVTDDEHRLEMARLAFTDISRAEISTFEIDRMRLSYTYDTLTAMQKEYTDKEIFFITGTDSFKEIDTWYKGIDLLKNFSFIVSVRPGCDEAELDRKIKEYRTKYNTKVVKLASQMPNISSTEIREKYRNGEQAASLVPQNVARYIAENELYTRD